jgi:hypothetical protein
VKTKATTATNNGTANRITSKVENLVIPAPNIQHAVVRLVGTAPLVINKFSHKSREKMMATQQAGSTARGKKAREARDFDADFLGAQHISEDGWLGVAAPAFRNAMISACRLVGFQMTKAKLSVFVDADGIDADDGTPLVRIDGPPPEKHTATVRNQTGVCDVRVRPMWRKWAVDLRVTWDADQFTLTDIVNLLDRAGQQVGVGEGRADSKSSAGVGWGMFRVERG